MQKQPTNNGRRLKDDTGDDDAIPMFGSLLVDEKSLTPYSDATQVSSCIQIKIVFFLNNKNQVVFLCLGIPIFNKNNFEKIDYVNNISNSI